MLGLFFSLLLVAGVVWLYFKIESIMRKKRRKLERKRSKPRGKGRSKAKVVTKSGEGPAGSSPRSSTKKGNQRIRVQRKEIPYWKKRGWKRRNGNLEGYFRTKYGSFKGKVKDFKRNPTLFIYDPPPTLKKHTHWRCFMPQGKKTFKVHFAQRVPLDAGAAIQSVEKILRQAFEK